MLPLVNSCCNGLVNVCFTKTMPNNWNVSRIMFHEFMLKSIFYKINLENPSTFKVFSNGPYNWFLTTEQQKTWLIRLKCIHQFGWDHFSGSPSSQFRRAESQFLSSKLRQHFKVGLLQWCVTSLVTTCWNGTLKLMFKNWHAWCSWIRR